MKTKLIKVQYSSRVTSSSCYGGSLYTSYPKIQMEGKWLEELGFFIGDQIVVEYEDNSIRIRTQSSEEKNALEMQRLKKELKRRECELKELEANLSMVAEPASEYTSPSHR